MPRARLVGGSTVAENKKKASSKKAVSKRTAIQRALKTEMPGWELAAQTKVPASTDAVVAPDVVGAGMSRLKQKYGAPVKKPNPAKNGSLVRVKLKGSADDAKSTKTALVHNGKVLGVQG